MGSGAKCGVAIWKAQKTIRDVHTAWEHRPEASLPGSEVGASKAWQEAGRLQSLLVALLVALLAAVLTGLWARTAPLL